MSEVGSGAGNMGGRQKGGGTFVECFGVRAMQGVVLFSEDFLVSLELGRCR